MEWVENNVRKRQNTSYHHFPQCLFFFLNVLQDFNNQDWQTNFQEDWSSRVWHSNKCPWPCLYTGSMLVSYLFVLMLYYIYLSVSYSKVVGWLVILGFKATLTAKVISWRSVTHMCFLAFSHQYWHNFLSKATDYFSHMHQQRWEAKIRRKESVSTRSQLTTTGSRVWHAHHWATWAGHSKVEGFY